MTDNYTAIEPVELSEDPWVGEELDLTGTKTVRHYMNDEEEAEEEELTDVTCKLEYEENEWSVKEGTEATCTETGVRTYTCSVYGEQKTETIPAKGHTPGAAETQSIGQTISPAASRETPVIQAKKTIKKTVKAADLKKKAKKFKIKASANSGGAITFAKVSGSKKITVSSKDKVKVAKNMKKGTYKIRVKISVQANGVYAAGTKTVTVKVKVK